MDENEMFDFWMNRTPLAYLSASGDFFVLGKLGWGTWAYED